MRKNLLVTLTLLVLLFLSGCVPSTTNKAESYFTGKEGVVAKFLDGSPPETVYVGKQFQVALDVENKGAYDTTPYAFFVGFDEKLLNIPKSFSGIGELKGKSKRRPQGDRKLVRVGTSYTPNLPDNTDLLQDIPIKLILCYSYKTRASLKVCIDPNPASGTEKVCKPSTITISAGQGAPIAVTSVKEEASIGTAFFEITIRNVGGGTVIKNEKVSNCIETTYVDENEVPVSVSLSGKPLECDIEGDVMLDNSGTAVIHCRAEGLGEGSEAYYTLLNVDIGPYGYKKISDTKSITIKRIS